MNEKWQCGRRDCSPQFSSIEAIVDMKLIITNWLIMLVGAIRFELFIDARFAVRVREMFCYAIEKIDFTQFHCQGFYCCLRRCKNSQLEKSN